MRKIWKECGYDAFADGIFGNGGQNLYVSKAGILQRIFHFDFNKDGYTDLFFSNSQDFNERPPIDVYSDIFGHIRKTELPTLGAYAAAVADLNGDGYEDLVIGNQNNGVHSDLMAFIYYGSHEGLSERYKLELHGPNCRAVAIGDFNGDGMPDIAFSCGQFLRIFYQEKGGFRPDKFVDWDIEITHMAAADLDGDGCAELYVRVLKELPRIFWGGPQGIDPKRFTTVGCKDKEIMGVAGSSPGWQQYPHGWIPKIVMIKGLKHIFRVEESNVAFYTTGPDRQLNKKFSLSCEHAIAAAAGNIRGQGRDDLVIITSENINEESRSRIYWNNGKGFDETKKTAIQTQNARDVTLADLSGDGCADIIVAQGRTDILNTTESLIFKGTPEGINPEPLRIITHDAITAFAARTSGAQLPEVIFVNHVTGRVRGDVCAYVYYNGPDGFTPTRRVELPGWSSPAALCCDFNDDGWADILMSNCAENAVAEGIDPGAFLYWGSPKGFDPKQKLVLPTYRGHGLAAGDFRHRGYLDVMVGGFGNPELLQFCGGPGGFDLANPRRILIDDTIKNYDARNFNSNYTTLNPELSEVRFLFSADFNNDGWLDVFVPLICGPRSLILWGGPDGFSMKRATWLNVDGACAAQAADLTGNGYLDLVIGGHNCQRTKKYELESYVYIYWGGPDGFREDRRAQLPAHACNSIAIADFNNDGILDIFVTSYNSGRHRDLDSYIYWGKAGGLYSVTNRKRLFSHSACGCMAADFNEDGWIDLAVACHKTHGNHAGQSQVWWNGPNGFSEERKTLLPTLGPHGMLSANPGNIKDRGMEEYYISSQKKIEEKFQITSIGWEADIPPKTWVKAQIRFAAHRELLDQARWQGAEGFDSWFENGQRATGLRIKGCWMQYRLALGAINSGNTPRVKCVQVEYEV